VERLPLQLVSLLISDYLSFIGRYDYENDCDFLSPFFSNLDTIKSTGLCFYFIGHGTCPNKPIVFSYMKQLCKSNYGRAINLMTHVIKKESSLHAELLKDWGSISSTVTLNFATVSICIVNSIG
jgi:hypothetical protein